MPTRDTFIFYRSFYEAISDLPDKDQLEIYKAIAEYSLNFKDIPLTGLPKTIFTLIKPNLEANNKRYINGVKGGEHGKKGGRPPKEETPTEPQGKPLENPKPTPNKDKDVDKDKDVNKDKDIYKQDFPFFFSSKEFSEVWLEFLALKKSKKAAVTPRALKSQLKKLNEWSKGNVQYSIKVLEKSLNGGWSDLYELKGDEKQITLSSALPTGTRAKIRPNPNRK